MKKLFRISRHCICMLGSPVRTVVKKGCLSQLLNGPWSPLSRQVENTRLFSSKSPPPKPPKPSKFGGEYGGNSYNDDEYDDDDDEYTSSGSDGDATVSTDKDFSHWSREDDAQHDYDERGRTSRGQRQRYQNNPLRNVRRWVLSELRVSGVCACVRGACGVAVCFIVCHMSYVMFAWCLSIRACDWWYLLSMVRSVSLLVLCIFAKRFILSVSGFLSQRAFCTTAVLLWGTHWGAVSWG